MTVEDIKKEIERMQDVTKDIKVSVGNLRSDINKLMGEIKCDSVADRQKAYQEGEEKGYLLGLAEGLKQAEEHDGCKGCFYEPCGENEEPCISCKYRYKSQYRRADDKIRVGDEVIDHTQSKAYTGFVIEVQSADVLKMMSLKDGIWSVRRSNVDKTGRHFPEVEKILEAMRT